MKNKFLILLISALMVTLTGFGQVHFGIRGGINVSQVKNSDEFTYGDYKITYPNYAMLGYHVGLIGQIQMFNLFIQPEALYTVTRNDINIYDLTTSSGDYSDQATQTLNRIDFPIMFGFKKNVFKIGVGPVVTFLISDDSDLERITHYDMQLNKATVGYQAGIGFDIKKLAIDIKYEGSLSKMGHGIDLGNGQEMAFDSRLSQFILSLGLFF